MRKLRTFIFLMLVGVAIAQTNAQGKKSFRIEDGSFQVNKKPIHIYSGEMHYSRIPKEYWRHRLRMIKAMGLNTVATYVFWNYHEVEPGKWDFSTGNKNLAEYIKTAKEEGLYVILRPGPYVCAEWEFGGYPFWLQNNPELEIRANNQAFLDSCKVYLGKLAEQVADLQVSKGGNIIMTQVENEFGSYVSQRQDVSAEDHLAYRTKIYEMLQEVGFDGPFFTSDGSWLFEGGAIDGVLPTANGEGNVNNLKKAVNKYHNDEGPYMVAEFYSGWLDHWAEDFITIGTESLTNQAKTYLENGVDFNFYMVHGGTNFGFTSGANYNDEHDIQPDLTSYDYNAPISEAGWATPKYKAIRELMKKHVSYEVPTIPDQIPVIAIPSIEISKSADALSYIKKQKPVKSETPLTYEELMQQSGYVLYKKRFTQPINGKLKIEGLRDYATVYVNGKRQGVLNRVFNNYEMDITIPFNGTLEILVENMGRINYGAEIVHNKKGIISPVTINDYEITGNWEMYQAPFDEAPSLDNLKEAKTGLPVIYEATFNLKTAGDTFLDMTNWGKGIVFVNGHNLGRYWKVGPQQTLYVPGCWLNEGDNTIVVFEQLNDTQQSAISSVKEPILMDLKAD
ncbi:glycoside hydrolase family 35 protein [Fulvivirga sediminis]|uniref:Beta-galactosidase n=1 Tax=Fulvivirga sediminis TaxID=2803949 RepID=A0A937K032_9BACT|nr:beta-galactosidase [Fulvivirga sediminis]MBL3655886.1 beta-galactosidase [Fulvivirga sediminis]